MLTSKYEERIADIEHVLLIKNELISMDEVRNLSTYGINDQLRPLCWRILLNYLPLKRSEWKDKLTKYRNDYDSMVENIFTKPGEFFGDSCDHPLADNPESKWELYFKDNEVLLQIDKDARRLRPEIDFFQRKTRFPHKIAAAMQLSQRISQSCLSSKSFEVSKLGNELSNYDQNPDYMNASIVQLNGSFEDSNNEAEELHWQVVERILFVYSKINLGVKYVQGMNEILGPIYFVFASDPDLEWTKYAEADAFYCFQNLMTEIQDNFIKTMDTSHIGIEAMMEKFYNLFEKYDPELYTVLVSSRNIKPQYYAFRWLSLLLSQEFSLPDVIMLWDCLLADKTRFELLYYVCLAMLEEKREELLSGDFGDNMRLLQNYPINDIIHIVSLAYEIKDGRHNKKSESLSLKSTTSERTANAKIAINNAVKNILTKFKR
uniref:TBC1 domain family member 13 n=1 Tax=Parastrongyloides trichosuri TaxID=131310 RepID=A0A0N4ZWW4_PARTI